MANDKPGRSPQAALRRTDTLARGFALNAASGFAENGYATSDKAKKRYKRQGEKLQYTLAYIGEKL